jgi:hypothetical protein
VAAFVAGVLCLLAGSWWWAAGWIVAGLILNGVAREQAAKRRAARAAGVEPPRPSLELFCGGGEYPTRDGEGWRRVRLALVGAPIRLPLCHSRECHRGALAAKGGNFLAPAGASYTSRARWVSSVRYS